MLPTPFFGMLIDGYAAVAALRSICVASYEMRLDSNLWQRARRKLVKLEKMRIFCEAPDVRELSCLSLWSKPLSCLDLNTMYKAGHTSSIGQLQPAPNKIFTREHALAFESLPFLKSLSLYMEHPKLENPGVLIILMQKLSAQINNLDLRCNGMPPGELPRWNAVRTECVSIAERRFRGTTVYSVVHGAPPATVSFLLTVEPEG